MGRVHPRVDLGSMAVQGEPYQGHRETTVKLAPGTSVEQIQSGFALRSGTRHVALDPSWGRYLDALEELAVRDLSEAAWAERFVEAGGDEGADRLRGLLPVLESAGLLSRTLRFEGQPVAKLAPVAAPRDAPERAVQGRDYHLGRFGLLRVEEGDLVLSSPLSTYRLMVIDPRVLLAVWRLASRANADQLEDLAPGVGRALLELLCRGRLVEEASPSSPKTSPPWEFHELLFHTASRLGGRDVRIGATYPGAESGPAPPGIPPTASDVPVIPLPVPPAGSKPSVPFEQVLWHRRSITSYGRRPVRLIDLAELLRLSCRLTNEGRPAGSNAYPVYQRNYPSGGGIHCLDVYPVVMACEGLLPGVYRYDPRGHALELRAPGPGIAEGLVRAHGVPLTGSTSPPIMLLMTARM